MEIELGTGRGLSQASLGPGWARKLPNTDDARYYPTASPKCCLIDSLYRMLKFRRKIAAQRARL